MKIEHWAPQSVHPDLQLDYHNLLGACVGEVRDGEPDADEAHQKSRRESQHCDTHKGNTKIKVHPADSKHRCDRLVKYRFNGGVYSDDPDVQRDLNSTRSTSAPRRCDSSVAAGSSRGCRSGLPRCRRGSGPRVIRREIGAWQRRDDEGNLRELCQVVVYYLQRKLPDRRRMTRLLTGRRRARRRRARRHRTCRRRTLHPRTCRRRTLHRRTLHRRTCHRQASRCRKASAGSGAPMRSHSLSHSASPGKRAAAVAVSGGMGMPATRFWRRRATSVGSTMAPLPSGQGTRSGLCAGSRGACRRGSCSRGRWWRTGRPCSGRTGARRAARCRRPSPPVWVSWAGLVQGGGGEARRWCRGGGPRRRCRGGPRRGGGRDAVATPGGAGAQEDGDAAGAGGVGPGRRAARGGLAVVVSGGAGVVRGEKVAGAEDLELDLVGLGEGDAVVGGHAVAPLRLAGVEGELVAGAGEQVAGRDVVVHLPLDRVVARLAEDARHAGGGADDVGEQGLEADGLPRRRGGVEEAGEADVERGGGGDRREARRIEGTVDVGGAAAEGVRERGAGVDDLGRGQHPPSSPRRAAGSWVGLGGGRRRSRCGCGPADDQGVR